MWLVHDPLHCLLQYILYGLGDLLCLTAGKRISIERSIAKPAFSKITCHAASMLCSLT